MPRARHWIFRLVVLAVFAICFFKRWNGPAIADEVDFLRPLQAWVEKGPQRWGMWHSPFYPWLVSLIGKLAGGLTPGLARLVGLGSILGTALLIDQSAAFLKRKDSERNILWTLSLLSPVTFGSALLLDYDNTLLVLGTAFFFYTLIRLKEFRVWPLSTALALALLSKETTPLVYPLGVWIAYRSFKKGLLVGITGVGLFAAITGLWCAIFQLPFSAVFEMAVLGMKVHGVPTAYDTARALWIKLMPAVWMGWPLALAFMLSLGRVSFWKNFQPALQGILGVIVAVLLTYTFAMRQMTYHFPKYMTPVLPWIPLLFLTRRPISVSVSSRLLPLIPTSAVARFFIGFFGPNPLFLIYERTAQALPVAIGIFAIVIALWFFWPKLRGSFSWPQASVLLSLILCGVTVRTALTQDFSLTYWYGDRAILQAREYMNQWRQAHSTRPGWLISTNKDIAWDLREDGAQFIPAMDLSPHQKDLCGETRSGLVITRRREETSLTGSPFLIDLAKCLKIEPTGSDVVVGVTAALK